MGSFFAIASYAIDAAINYIDKFLLSKYILHPTIITVYSGFMAVVASFFIILFTGFHKIDTKSLLIIVSSGLLTEMILLPYFKALTLDETSRVVPLFQFVPVIVIALSTIILHEHFLLKQFIGAVIIILAGFLLSVKKIESRIFTIRPALWYMLLASFFSALAIILFKLGLHDIGFWSALPYEGFGIGLGAVLIFLYPSNTREILTITRKLPKKVFFLLSLGEFIYILSRYTRYFAISLIAASIVSVLSGFQPFFVLVYGLLLSIYFPKAIKEVLSKGTLSLKIGATVSIFIGLYLIFL